LGLFHFLLGLFHFLLGLFHFLLGLFLFCQISDGSTWYLRYWVHSFELEVPGTWFREYGVQSLLGRAQPGGSSDRPGKRHWILGVELSFHHSMENRFCCVVTNTVIDVYTDTIVIVIHVKKFVMIHWR